MIHVVPDDICAHHDLVLFTLPKCNGGSGWSLLIDTHAPEHNDEPAFDIGHGYEVASRGLVTITSCGPENLACPPITSTRFRK
jgi:hypothetical protein